MSSGQIRAGAGVSEHRERDKRVGLPKFYTTKEIAEMLGVSIRSARRWIERGELVAHRLGGAVRISEADLKTFLTQRRES